MLSIRPRFNHAQTRMDAYLKPTPKLDRDDFAMQYLRIQDLSGRVARYTAGVREMTKTASSSIDGKLNISPGEVCEMMALFTHELEDLYWAFPADTRSSSMFCPAVLDISNPIQSQSA